MKTIIHIIKKELFQLKRDRKLFGIVILAPILQLIFLGYAATLDINNIDTIIFDQNKTSASRELIEKFTGSGYFTIRYFVNSLDEINELIDQNKASVAIIIPYDFETKLRKAETAALGIFIDGSDGNKASIGFGYIASITSAYSQKILIERMNKFGKKPDFKNINPEMRVWYNPDLKTRSYMVPSILGMIMMIITIALVSMAIVKEREVGTLEQLIVSPIKPYQLIIGKLIPYFLIANISLILIIIVMIFWFGINIRGSFILLYFASMIFVLSTMGLGLLASTVSKTQQQAMMISIFIFNMPIIYLSGFIFPIENMPDSIQIISYLIPLKYYLLIIRGIILKGTGFIELWDNFAIMFLLGISLLAFSSLRFKKRLE